MGKHSLDIVSDFDSGEMNHVFDQSKREIQARYDFKGTPADLDWMPNKGGLVVTGSSGYQVEAILEIVRKKLATRGLSQKVLDISQEAVEANLKTTKKVPFVKGLSGDKAKKS